MTNRSPITQAVAALLRARIAYLGLNTSAVARETGMNREVLRRYLSAERDLPLDALFTITDALDMDPAALLHEAQQIARGDAEA